MQVEARCMKCKETRTMKDAEETVIESKGGRKQRAARGVCPVCGTKMFKFLPKEDK